jgi:hypothetical protein
VARRFGVIVAGILIAAFRVDHQGDTDQGSGAEQGGVDFCLLVQLHVVFSLDDGCCIYEYLSADVRM